MTEHLAAHQSLPADAERERIFIETLPNVRIARGMQDGVARHPPCEDWLVLEALAGC